MSNMLAYWVTILSMAFGISVTLGGFIYWFGNKAGLLESEMKSFSINMEKNSEAMKTLVTKSEFEKEIGYINKRIDELGNRVNSIWLDKSNKREF